MSEDRPEYFTRQRRNIILISVFIIFYKIAGLEIEKINFLGNTTNIGNPDAVSLIVAIFFIYFSLRYWAACSEVSGIFKFTNSINKKAESIAYKKALKYALKNTNKNEDEFSVNVDSIKEETNPKKGYYYYLSDFSGTWIHEDSSRYNHFSFTGMSWFAIKIRATIKAIINETKFTEYILPFVLILLASLELINIPIISSIILIN